MRPDGCSGPFVHETQQPQRAMMMGWRWTKNAWKAEGDDDDDDSGGGGGDDDDEHVHSFDTVRPFVLWCKCVKCFAYI